MDSPLSAFQAQTSIASLNSEIKLLERQKERAQEELTQLDSVRAVEHKEHANKMNQARRDLAALHDKKKELQAECDELEKKIEKLTNDLKVYGENEVKKTEQAVQKLYEEAEETRQKATSLEEEVSTREASVSKREEEIFQREALADAKEHGWIMREITVKKKEEQIKKNEEETRRSLAEVSRKVDTLDRSIAQKTARDKGLTITIQIKEKAAQEMEVEALRKLNEAKGILAVAKAMKESSEAERKKLESEKRLIKDQRETLHRGFVELRRKGGNGNVN